MQYEIVTLPAKTVVGVACRTSNADPALSEKLDALWARFAACGLEDSLTYGLYTGYRLDSEAYDAVAACARADCPPDCVQIEIPAGEYARFAVRGDPKQALAPLWAAVNRLGLPRAWGVDFEEYRRTADGTVEVAVYVGLAAVCQSCGMPMTRPADHGTEQDGAPSAAYCTYCRQNGAFTYEATVEEQVEINLRHMPLDGAEPESVRARLLAYLPTLARWRGEN